MEKEKVDDKDKKIQELEEELKGLREFKEYFDELYGTGLEVFGWHMNGDPQPFDDFYEDACGGVS